MESRCGVRCLSDEALTRLLIKTENRIIHRKIILWSFYLKSDKWFYSLVNYFWQFFNFTYIKKKNLNWDLFACNICLSCNLQLQCFCTTALPVQILCNLNVDVATLLQKRGQQKAGKGNKNVQMTDWGKQKLWGKKSESWRRLRVSSHTHRLRDRVWCCHCGAEETNMCAELLDWSCSYTGREQRDTFRPWKQPTTDSTRLKTAQF